jgi:hypothetical protein
LYTNFIDGLSKGYLWHNECFALALAAHSDGVPVSAVRPFVS